LLVNAEYSSIEHDSARRSPSGPIRGGIMARGGPATETTATASRRGRSPRTADPGGPAPAAADRPGADLSAVIGRRLRTFRTAQGHTLRSLSARSGLSVGFLSQLERGQTSIGLTTLRDLAHCLGRQIADFFDDGPDGAGVDTVSGGSAGQPAGAVPGSLLPQPDPLWDRYFTLTRSSGEHSSQYISGLRTYRMLSQRAPGLILEPMLVEIAPGGRMTEQEVHDGEEFAYVVSGELTFTVAGSTHRLGPGDSLHLKSSIPHSLRNETDRVVTVVSVVTPRLF
jgi:quercetin dioxygenase-like cupin family protein